MRQERIEGALRAGPPFRPAAAPSLRLTVEDARARAGGPMIEQGEIFEDRTYAVLGRDLDRPQRTGPSLILIAALVAALAIGAVAVGSGMVELPLVDRLAVPTPSASEPSEASEA